MTLKQFREATKNFDDELVLSIDYEDGLGFKREGSVIDVCFLDSDFNNMSAVLLTVEFYY